jgi:hypothetical protein
MTEFGGELTVLAQQMASRAQSLQPCGPSGSSWPMQPDSRRWGSTWQTRRAAARAGVCEEDMAAKTLLHPWFTEAVSLPALLPPKRRAAYRKAPDAMAGQ